MKIGQEICLFWYKKWDVSIDLDVEACQRRKAMVDNDA